jgi:serine protease
MAYFLKQFGGRSSNFWPFWTDSSDQHGHGTFCAGIIGSQSYGIAQNALIYSVKILNNTGVGTFSSLMAGANAILGRIKTSHPAVASISLSGPVSTDVNNIIQELHDARITVIVSAGNDNMDACQRSPASATAEITVGSTDATDTRSEFSKWGSCVYIFAPGRDITSIGKK